MRDSEDLLRRSESALMIHQDRFSLYGWSIEALRCFLEGSSKFFICFWQAYCGARSKRTTGQGYRVMSVLSPPYLVPAVFVPTIRK
jgi:hypothetical protein